MLKNIFLLYDYSFISLQKVEIIAKFLFFNKIMVFIFHTFIIT